MVRMLLTVLVAGAVCWAAVTPAFSAQNSSVQPDKTAPPAAATDSAKAGRNPAPLPPGGAAGITAAQGTGERIWNIIGVSFIVGVGVAMAVVDGGSDDAPSAPTTTGN
jgi:hypothetical protein